MILESVLTPKYLESVLKQEKTFAAGHQIFKFLINQNWF
jgi:hypothetical protein